MAIIAIRLFLFPLLMVICACVFFSSLFIFDSFSSDFWFYTGIASFIGSIVCATLHLTGLIRFRPSNPFGTSAKKISLVLAIYITTPYLLFLSWNVLKLYMGYH